MRTLRALLSAFILVAIAAPSAPAATGFDDAQVIGAGPVDGRPVAAVNAGGARALAWAAGVTATDLSLTVARGGPDGGWTLSKVGRGVGVRDLQLVVTTQGETVAAWHAGGRVMAAVARRGGPFLSPQVLSTAAGHTPRLAALADGRVALVWRSSLGRARRLQLTIREPGRRFDRARGLPRDRGTAPAIAATTDGGAIVAWSTADGTLRAARLRAGARSPRRSFAVARSVRAGPRLAAGPDNVVVVSWSRAGAAAHSLTARIWPGSPQPARALVAADARPVNAVPVSLALGPDGSAVAAITAFGLTNPGPRILATRGTVAAGWRDPAFITPQPLAFANTPRVAMTAGGDALVMWSNPRPVAGPPQWEIFVARSPRGATVFGAAEILGLGPDRYGRGADSVGIGLAYAGEHIVAAWRAPGPGGGVAVATGR
jgi:hypothetical protein